MRTKIKAILTAKSGISCMRVMSLMCCITAIIIAVLGLYKDSTTDYSGLTLLVSAFLTAAFTGKIMQKNIENKPS